ERSRHVPLHQRRLSRPPIVTHKRTGAKTRGQTQRHATYSARRERSVCRQDAWCLDTIGLIAPASRLPARPCILNVGKIDLSAPELAIGHIVDGKYAIQGLLNHAGVIATYRASTDSNQQVALKFYDPRLAAFPEVENALTRC